MLDKAHTKKAMKLLANTVEEWEECDPTTSFGGAYNKQLELEEVRVQTERSREQRENTQHLMTMLKELIASATTPQEKSAYQAELVDLMRQAVAQAKLKAPVFSSTSADSMPSTSSPSAASTSSGT